MDSVTSRLILASSSPRRKMLLEQLGLTFDVVVSDIDERLDASLPPEQIAERLAFEKAAAVAAAFPDALVIGADTIVVDERHILGKPKDAADAARMLAHLSGNTHCVMTGLAMISTHSPQKTLIRHETTQVKIAPLTAQDIEWYIQTGEPLDKAGAYGIQGKGAMFVEWIHGCYNNVVGLPLFLCVQMLKEMSCEWSRAKKQ